MCSAGVLHYIAYLHRTIVSGKIARYSRSVRNVFPSGDAANVTHRSVALWRRVIVPAAGHSARLHCATTQGRRSIARFCWASSSSTVVTLFTSTGIAARLCSSRSSRVTFQLILKQQPRPVIMTKMAIGFRKDIKSAEYYPAPAGVYIQIRGWRFASSLFFLCLQRLIETGINNKMAIIAQPQLFCAGADIVLRVRWYSIKTSAVNQTIR